MRKHAETGRQATRTEKRYYLGARYHREKKREGGDGSNQHKKQQLSQGDSVATRERIASEEGIAPKTVQRAAEFAQQVDELDAHIGHGVKWDILAERIA